MTLAHAAIWTDKLEELRLFYVRFFGGSTGQKYKNPTNGFESYFVTFSGGAQLELMSKPNIPENRNDTVELQHKGLIHVAFGAKTMQEVDEKEMELRANGFPILRGPRKTGDGYYEFETRDPDENRLEVTTLWVD